MTPRMKILISFRLDPGLLSQLKVASSGPYAPSQTKIVERGIELALRELQSGKRIVGRKQSD